VTNSFRQEIDTSADRVANLKHQVDGLGTTSATARSEAITALNLVSSHDKGLMVMDNTLNTMTTGLSPLQDMQHRPTDVQGATLQCHQLETEAKLQHMIEQNEGQKATIQRMYFVDPVRASDLREKHPIIKHSSSARTSNLLGKRSTSLRGTPHIKTTHIRYL